MAKIRTQFYRSSPYTTDGSYVVRDEYGNITGVVVPATGLIGSPPIHLLQPVDVLSRDDVMWTDGGLCRQVDVVVGASNPGGMVLYVGTTKIIEPRTEWYFSCAWNLTPSGIPFDRMTVVPTNPFQFACVMLVANPSAPEGSYTVQANIS